MLFAMGFEGQLLNNDMTQINTQLDIHVQSTELFVSI